MVRIIEDNNYQKQIFGENFWDESIFTEDKILHRINMYGCYVHVPIFL